MPFFFGRLAEPVHDGGKANPLWDRDKNRPLPGLDFPGVPTSVLIGATFAVLGADGLPWWVLHGIARVVVGVLWAALIDLPVAATCALLVLGRAMDAREAARKMREAIK
jgi:hypothetical protein